MRDEDYDEYPVDWEDDTIDSIVSDSRELMQEGRVRELERRRRDEFERYAFSQESEKRFLKQMTLIAFVLSQRLSEPVATQLKAWVFITVTDPHNATFFDADEYAIYVRLCLSAFSALPRDFFARKPIKVVGKNQFRTSDDPHTVTIDNFTYGEIEFDFNDEKLTSIKFTTDRPRNALESTPTQWDMQRRHVLSVRLIKDALTSFFIDQMVGESITKIQKARDELKNKLNIRSWPAFPSEETLSQEDYLYSLSVYDTEMSAILTRADEIQLSAIEQLALYCHGLDHYHPFLREYQSTLDLNKLFAGSLAELFRNFIHASHNQFIGPRSANELMGKLIYLLRPHVLNWRGERQFPLRLGVNYPNEKPLRDYFFGQNIPPEEKKYLIFEDRHALLDWYFNANYDYQEIKEPKLTNHMQLFKHTYKVSCPEAGGPSNPRRTNGTSRPT